MTEPGHRNIVTRDTWATVAFVLRGRLPAIDEKVRQLREQTDLKVVYIRVSAGRLKILDEQGAP
ncbi:MAG: hypothetical protein L3J96_00335 [Thermoplasmata archaeon]|nr:hypothetical protein [Thermoplasmata archaeon]